MHRNLMIQGNKHLWPLNIFFDAFLERNDERSTKLHVRNGSMNYDT